ncbi:MAG TPA: suppressor of fused domain protein [Thermoanaerobaculia bacterium]|nr:suppressor of fused domain protein [Thermoanaerobaculia bacterium]
MSEDNDWFEDTWRYREKVLYPQEVGGDAGGLITTIPYEAFAQMGFEQIDPRWLHCGVLTFPPTAKRTNFTFLTSGLSNAWDDDRPELKSVSGLGIELRLENASAEHWVKDVMLRLSATQLLIGVGRLSGARLLGDGDRVKVGAEAFGESSAMTALLATKVASLQLPSGTFEMIQLFAITDAEREFAATRGAGPLLGALRESTTYPINDIRRRSIV